MIDVPGILSQITGPADTSPVAGGISFKQAAPVLAGVVDNGVCPDDPRVLARTNEATKIIMDTMIPVGGMTTANINAIDTVLVLPPGMENVIEAVPVEPSTKVRGDSDITQAWYEIMNNSVYLDPFQHHDNPMIDLGLWPAPWPGYEGQLLRVYQYPGLEPSNATVATTGKKRFVPLKSDDDFLQVQNLEALKLIILSIERNENAAPDEAPKYRQQAFELLQSEVKNHLLDPRNYMRRKSAYYDDLVKFPENTHGWMRANLALDIERALKSGKSDLSFAINQVERRIMQRGIYKDCVIEIQATVVGGMIYFPLNVGSVLAIDIGGQPIPIRSQFFQHLENGPGGWPSHPMLIDQGDEFIPSEKQQRRKYKLVANCTTGQVITAVCKLRWIEKKPHDLMTIKNYEAIRLMVASKFLEEEEKWNESKANQQQAFEILDKELQDYLGGIRHTVHVQTVGFGLGDVGGYCTM